MEVYRLEEWISTMKISQFFDGLFMSENVTRKMEESFKLWKMGLKEKIDVYRTHNRSWSLSWINSD